MRDRSLRLHYFTATQTGALIPATQPTAAGKFIVVETKEGIVVFLAPPLSSGLVYYHADLIRTAGESILNVLGGGHYTQEQGIWRLYGRSEQFGSCTPALLRYVAGCTLHFARCTDPECRAGLGDAQNELSFDTPSQKRHRTVVTPSLFPPSPNYSYIRWEEYKCYIAKWGSL
jgi:hypothetical protein